jgi:hypothetical protein
MAQENGSWGYDRIAGALANLGHHIADQTVGNVLKRHGIPTAPKRSQATTWKDFISAHMAVLAGSDFFTVEVLTCRGLATYYALFFLNGEPAHHSCGHHAPSHRSLDDANGAQRCRRHFWGARRVSLRAPRPGCEILCGL